MSFHVYLQGHLRFIFCTVLICMYVYNTHICSQTQLLNALNLVSWPVGPFPHVNAAIV